MNEHWLAVAFATILMFVALGQSAEAAQDADLVKKATAAEPGGTDDAKAIEGLWAGSWGDMVDAAGAVFQPVTAELFIDGDHVELTGFPKLGKLTGTVHVDTKARQMVITPSADAGGQRKKTIAYAYKMRADELSLIDSDKFAISLSRQPVVKDPVADAQVDLVAATGINADGDLLVSEFTLLRAGKAETTFFQPMDRALKTKNATVLRIEETGWTRITVGDARRLIHQPTPVAVAYGRDDRRSWQQPYQLWKEVGPPQPDSEVVARTFSRLLRPGTLVFILSARENILEP